MTVQFSDRNTRKGRHRPASLRVEASLSGAGLSLRSPARKNYGYGPPLALASPGSERAAVSKITYHRYLKGFSISHTNVTVSLRHCSQMRNNPFKETAVILTPRLTTSQVDGIRFERISTMTNKISAIVAAALILGSASVASAATAHKVVHRHYQAPQGQLMLLENAPRVPAYQGNAATNFQDNWDVSY